MMYLEDFCESVETLPEDMKHYFSHMKSLDTKMQTAYDTANKKFKKLCQNATKLTSASVSKERNEISKELAVALEHSDEKVQLSELTHDIVDKQIRRLDIELKKFKSDLEAARPGVTETLLNQSVAQEQEYRDALAKSRSQAEMRLAKLNKKGKKTIGRPSAESLKAREKKRQLKARQALQSAGGEEVSLVSSDDDESLAPRVGASGWAVPSADMVLDPNEQRYCYCNQVSFGEMVGCDNDDCKLEWFHYACVGLTEAPKGKWFCPDCRSADKKRKRAAGD
eukprot:m.17502 g.17502  ORF g.17502 m.17502 type:complete len:281 (-) comp11242_c0_seq2:539-1381(-)